MPYFVRYLKDRGYLYGKHYLPHDCKNTTLAAKSNPLGKNVWDQMWALGMRDLVRVERTPEKWTTINLTRTRIATACFDDTGCAPGLDALESYHKKWNETTRSYSNEPVHDWASNFADAIQQWADGWKGGAGATITFPQFTPGSEPHANRQSPRVHTVGQKRVGY